MAKISALPFIETLDGTEHVPLVKDGQTGRVDAADYMDYLAQGARLARDQAADLLLSSNIFLDVDLPTAEAGVDEGEFFKLVSSITGLAQVRQRTAIGSDHLYNEATAAALSGPAGVAMLGMSRGGDGARTRDLMQILLERPVHITDYENVYPDGSGDSSYALEKALAAAKLQGGSRILLPGNFLIGELEYDQANTIIEGRSAADRIIVKSGTLGFHIKKDWVHFRNLTIASEGTRDDGQNTCGILYSEGPGNSTGHILDYGVRLEGFSGSAVETRNALDLQFMSMFMFDCFTGLKVRREGVGPADFSTTMNLLTVYAIGCDIGFDLERVRHSKFQNVIAEWNRIGMFANLCDITIGERSYFENNSELGVDSLDSFVIEKDNYHNSLEDNIVRRWTPGVVAAADRYYRKEFKGDNIVKRLGLMTNHGADPQYFEAFGDATNRGYKYAGRIGATVRGNGVNLFNPNAWVSESVGANELKGFNVAEGGFEIAGNVGVATGCGMNQTVVLDNTKQYVLEWRTRLVSGTALNTARVGATIVQNGVAFTPPANGANLVKLFGVQNGDFQSFVAAISLSPVTTDTALTADIQERLTALPLTRGVRPMNAPPATTNGWAAGEFIPNGAKAVLGAPGSQYVLRGWTAIAGAWVEAREPTGT